MKPRGYIVDSHDNDSCAFGDDVALLRCRKCGELLAKWDEPLDGLRITRRTLDLSVTYDGIEIASAAFQRVVTVNRLSGLKFVPLPDDPKFFQVIATHLVPVDARKSGVEYDKQCRKCGRYESVTLGGGDLVLGPRARIPARGFVRTDLEFASLDEKCPMFLCGLNAGEILQKARLRGLVLEPLA
jgi:hypothetical protein